MLVKKLLRLDESLVKEIDDVVEKKSKKEFITWSSLVRKLIRLGLDKMKVEGK